MGPEARAISLDCSITWANKFSFCWSQSELGLLSLAVEIYNPSLTWWPSWVGFSQKQALRQRYECRRLLLDTLPGSTGSREGRRTGREPLERWIRQPAAPSTPGAQACWGRKREKAARKLVCLSASSHPSLAEKLFLGAPMPPPFPAGLFHERALLRRGVDRLVGELWGTHCNADCWREMSDALIKSVSPCPTPRRSNYRDALGTAGVARSSPTSVI